MNPFSRSLRSSLWILAGLAVVLGPLVFLYLKPAEGFQDPDSARIVALHVPMAWLATLFFICSAVYATRYIVGRKMDDDDAAAAAAEIGLLCCVLATVTGSIFAHSQWGSWWNWDPRETSIFFLLLVYGAYFSLRGSVEDPVRRAIFSGVYDMLACPVMFFLIFVMPRMFQSLHPERAHLHSSYWLALLSSFILLGGFLTHIFRIRCALGRRRLELAEVGNEPSDSVLRPTMVKH